MKLPDIALSRKHIIIIIVIVVLAEVIWAGLSLIKRNQLNQVPVVGKIVSNSITPQQASISLEASKTSYKVGEEISVTINIQTSKKTDGADVIVMFDPRMLAVQTVADGSNQVPVKAGTLYSIIPFNSLDKNSGKIIVSAVTSQAGGVIGNGILGTITFKALAAGSSKVSLDFTPGSTKDSNVTETKTAKDLLGKVSNLDLTITQ